MIVKKSSNHLVQNKGTIARREKVSDRNEPKETFQKSAPLAIGGALLGAIPVGGLISNLKSGFEAADKQRGFPELVSTSLGITAAFANGVGGLALLLGGGPACVALLGASAAIGAYNAVKAYS